MEIETLLTVTDAGPEFVAVTERVAVLPTVTLPKFSVPLVSESVVSPGDCWIDGPALTPWQATKKVKRVASRRAPASCSRGFKSLPADICSGALSVHLGDWLTDLVWL